GVFGGAEDRSLGAGQEQRDSGDVEAIAGKGERRQRHDYELKKLGGKRDAALAVLVREITAGDRKEQEGNREQQRYYEDEPQIALRFAERGFKNQKTHQPFQGVVAERILKLH